jgi:hypothetical protein
MRGVGAPRMMPPPLNPGSPQPKLSRKTSTMLGLSVTALARMGQNSSVQKTRLRIFMVALAGTAHFDVYGISENRIYQISSNIPVISCHGPGLRIWELW